jgi:hypothetical protein
VHSGGGNGGGPGSTLVFLLKSRVDTLRAVKQLSMTGPLYELAVTEVLVANPFPAGAWWLSLARCHTHYRDC